MSRHWDDPEEIEQRIREALVVDRFGRVSWDEYLRAAKRGR